MTTRTTAPLEGRPATAPDAGRQADAAGPWDALASTRGIPKALRPAWATLLRGARRAVANWPVASMAGGALEIEEPLARVVAGVGDALAGRPCTLADSQALTPLRPLLDALRREFLADAAADPALARDALLPMLTAMEEVQGLLAQDSAQRLAARLAETDALNLVVEVAHDMRSPLGSILFLAERLRRAQSGSINAVQERQLGLIYSAAFGLSSMAGDVMELARGGDRLLGREPVPFSVTEILHSVRDIVQPMAEEKGLTLRITSLEPDRRVGYPAALNRVLLNLTTNALKFTSEGTVDVMLQPTGLSRVTITVSDTGRGIPPQVMATLYDSFRRRHAPGDYTFSSAGLGLSICRKLIRLMGSELEVETALEQGTTFRFALELPAARRM
ncbi:MAG TPA: HAMP domain-containing sensor histidine kinase [Gemmatimonadaceae bacterium]|nr:HAMP domain-containing sensor histidine kinase [Gemmatimonadaceae bacterium]